MSVLLSSSDVLERARKARELSSPCRLCPRLCGVDRQAGETGYCEAGPEPSIAAALPHFGEEPPLAWGGGAGTIFFTRCNMACVYCQNHQISHGPTGDPITLESLAACMLDLQDLGCANIEAVSPSHHLPGFLEALATARGRGLNVPIVYNTNAYESSETLELLHGAVDVYLPDLKYASDYFARKYSGTEDYVETARAAILRMHSQVGNLVLDMHGRATRGMILRHLVLPGGISGTIDTLTWTKENLPRTVTLSLMAQYTPLHRSSEHPPLRRGISREEYSRAVDLAWEMGFENVFVQDLESQEMGIPDFSLDKPFDWGERGGKRVR